MGGHGIICDYSVNHPGCYNDSRVAAPIFERLNNPKWIPHKIATLVDVGLLGYCTNGSDGRAPVYRPLKNESVMEEDYEFMKEFSVFVTRFRQFNEWGSFISSPH